MTTAADCRHAWTTPKRALNRFGQLSTELYEASCPSCGLSQTRAGKRRLIAALAELSRQNCIGADCHGAASASEPSCPNCGQP